MDCQFAFTCIQPAPSLPNFSLNCQLQKIGRNSWVVGSPFSWPQKLADIHLTGDSRPGETKSLEPSPLKKRRKTPVGSRPNEFSINLRVNYIFTPNAAPSGRSSLSLSNQRRPFYKLAFQIFGPHCDVDFSSYRRTKDSMGAWENLINLPFYLAFERFSLASVNAISQ